MTDEQKADAFANRMMKPNRYVADDPGPDPNPKCKRCHGLGCVRTKTLPSGRVVMLARFKHNDFHQKGFACPACHPAKP